MALGGPRGGQGHVLSSRMEAAISDNRQPAGRSPPWPSGASLGNHGPPGLLGPCHGPSASPSPGVPPSLARHVAQCVAKAPASLVSLSPQGLELFKRRTRVTVSPPETWVPNLEAGDRAHAAQAGLLTEGAGTGARAGRRPTVVYPEVTRASGWRPSPCSGWRAVTQGARCPSSPRPRPTPAPTDRSQLVVCGAPGLARTSGHPDYLLLLSPPQALGDVQTAAMALEAAVFQGGPVLGLSCWVAPSSLGPTGEQQVSMAARLEARGFQGLGDEAGGVT